MFTDDEDVFQTNIKKANLIGYTCTYTNSLKKVSTDIVGQKPALSSP